MGIPPLFKEVYVGLPVYHQVMTPVHGAYS